MFICCLWSATEAVILISAPGITLHVMYFATLKPSFATFAL